MLRRPARVLWWSARVLWWSARVLWWSARVLWCVLLQRRRACWLQLAALALLATFCVHVLWSSSAEHRRTKRQLLRRLAATQRSPGQRPSCSAGARGTSPRAWLAVGSPQLGETGPYRVVYDYAPAVKRVTGNRSVTYCTHVTAERLERTAALLTRWDGPLSVAVFVLPDELCSLAVQLARLRRCTPGFRRRVSVHLVYHVARAPNLTRLAPPDQLAPSDCARPLPAPVSERRRLRLPYPVNVARNAARRAARTHFVLSSDAELLPAVNTSALFLQLMARVGRGEEPRLAVTSRQVYVLPVFEVEQRMPGNKSDLVGMLRSGEAVWFHRHVCPHCQRFPGVSQYTTKRFTPGKVAAFSVTYRQVPYHRWEPIYIGTDAEPLYDERLSWEGKQDKMTQMTALCLRRYRMVVLDQLYLVHAPQPGGIRRQPGFTDPADAWRAAFIEENQRHYQRIVARLPTPAPSSRPATLHYTASVSRMARVSKQKFSQLGAEKPSGGRSSARLELLCDLARLRAEREGRLAARLAA
ncbi:beta-1,4-glucuronyltransferase 1-like [Pollicipes pollicipes]|uniref:beta-1,4-glucuronyltransferase 1-like n=1 Tax=Pollicipes pollicipes TaxID=41117 RepID=UPI0018850CC0|nr:beta-1,4-glucuronyltransferase 1-like [Pollicipes pollicipes]